MVKKTIRIFELHLYWGVNYKIMCMVDSAAKP